MADYLAHAEERLVQEEQRVTHYLEPSTRRPLLTAVENALIAAHADGILQKGFDRLVEQGRVAVRASLPSCRLPNSLLIKPCVAYGQDLARLYTLFSRVQSLPLVRVAFNTHIRAAGAEIVNDAERDKTMVPTLLELKVRRATHHPRDKLASDRPISPGTCCVSADQAGYHLARLVPLDRHIRARHEGGLRAFHQHPRKQTR